MIIVIVMVTYSFRTHVDILTYWVIRQAVGPMTLREARAEALFLYRRYGLRAEEVV